MTLERLADTQAVGWQTGLEPAAAEVECRAPGNLRRNGKQGFAVEHHLLVIHVATIPFEQGKFGVVKCAALAVAEDLGKGENSGFAGGQELLAREFRRCIEVNVGFLPRHRLEPGREGMQMQLVAGRDLENWQVDFAKSLALEIAAHRRHQLVAQDQARPAVGMDVPGKVR